jgi:hypothetical protein
MKEDKLYSPVSLFNGVIHFSVETQVTILQPIRKLKLEFNIVRGKHDAPSNQSAGSGVVFIILAFRMRKKLKF